MQVSRRKALSPFLGLDQPEQPVNSHDSHIRISVSAAQQSCRRIRARPRLKHTGATLSLRYWFMQSRAPLKKVLMKPRERNCGQMSGTGGGENRGWFCFLRSHGICLGREPRTRLCHRNCTRKTKIKGTRW